MTDHFSMGCFTTDIRALTVDTVQQAVEESWPHAEGWLQYASGIVARRGAEEHKTGDGAVGIPLCGEWVLEGVSYALRQAPGGWVLVTSTRTAGDNKIEAVKLLSDLGGETLHYEVEWRTVDQGHPAVGVWTPSSSRFIGWEK